MARDQNSSKVMNVWKFTTVCQVMRISALQDPEETVLGNHSVITQGHSNFPCESGEVLNMLTSFLLLALFYVLP